MADFANFQRPPQIQITHPWVARYSTSFLLENPAETIVTLNVQDREVYGDPEHPVSFRIGNGGAGYTGLLRALAERFISTHGGDFRIGWVTNPSKPSLAAMLADIVQVSLSYDLVDEEKAEKEGWCRRVCKAFNDHFLLVGPSSNPADLPYGEGVLDTLRLLATNAEAQATGTVIFHSRGDISATYAKESSLWQQLGIDPKAQPWYQTVTLPPYDAVKAANTAGAYLLSDRSTYLTAKQDGLIDNLRVFCEGGIRLLNPCFASVNSAIPDAVDGLSGRKQAAVFAAWLEEEDAKAIIRHFGEGWKLGKLLFTIPELEDHESTDRLVGMGA